MSPLNFEQVLAVLTKKLENAAAYLVEAASPETNGEEFVASIIEATEKWPKKNQLNKAVLFLEKEYTQVIFDVEPRDPESQDLWRDVVNTYK